MMLSVAWDADAQEELRRLPSAERRAVMTAVAKLEAFGDQLGAPHSSQVKGGQAGIRELRPRAGRSPWRVLYRRLGGAMVPSEIWLQRLPRPRMGIHGRLGAASSWLSLQVTCFVVVICTEASGMD